MTERKKSKISFGICLDGRTGRRRIAAYQSASDAQHNTLTWSQSAEILDEHEHEVITDNQQSTAHDVLSPITNNSRNTARANSWKHVVESDSEDRRHVDVKLENATSRPLGSNAKLSDLHSLQQSIALQNKHLDNIASQQLTKDSVREQQQQQRQPWSISSQNKLDIWITSTNIPQQTVIYDEKQVPMEAIKQQHIYHHQIDDKWRPIFSNAQNDTIQTTNASRSMIIPVQESKVYTQIESTSKRKNLIPQQKQSQAVVQKIDISQIQQRNELSKQTPSEQLILRHNAHMSQNETAEDITSLASDLFDSEVARQMLTNHARIQNSKKSSDEQLTGLQEVKMSEPQIARIKTNDPGNKLKKLVENRITNEVLISNRALDNSVDDNYNIPTDRNSGRLISNEIITSVDSFPPKFRRKNGVHRQMNKVNEPWKEINRFTEKIANSSTRGRANSQSVNTHLSHKAYGNAIAVAKDTESTQLSRDSVLRHHVRIINQGSALETSSSNLSLSVSSSVLPTLSPSFSLLPSSTIPPSSTLSSSTSSSSLSSPLLPSDTKTHLNTFTKISHSSTSDNNENFNGKPTN